MGVFSTMKLLAVAGLAASIGLAQGQDTTQWPVHDNGLTDLVEWYASCQLIRKKP